MRLILLSVCLLSGFSSAPAQILTGARGEKFEMRTVIQKLSDPWAISYGPDNYLWVTESRGYTVSRVHPLTGEKQQLLDLTPQRNFPRYDLLQKETNGKPWPQSGLMGMALHPDLLDGSPYVFLVYIDGFEGAGKKDNGCRTDFRGCYFKARLVRYTYFPDEQKLREPVVLCDSIPQSNDHNGGRLMIAPVNGKNYLFYTTGDMGAGQFDNGGRPNHVQDTASYEGKVLRFHTEPDDDDNTGDRWIPDDNPFNGERQNAVWSYGHRNPQGIAYAIFRGETSIYSAEHGPFSDDEINRIERGKNYGHPLIVGYADGNYDGLAAGVSAHTGIPGRWNTAYPVIGSEKRNAAVIGPGRYRDPMYSIAPNSRNFLKKLFRRIIGGADTKEWPSEAPSSIAVYTQDAIPGWKNSLLITTLKGGKLIRMKLSDDGRAVSGDTLQYFHAKERMRDLALSPDGSRIYVATDSSFVTSGPTKDNPSAFDCRGCIVEYRYVPPKP